MEQTGRCWIRKMDGEQILTWWSRWRVTRSTLRYSPWVGCLDYNQWTSTSPRRTSSFNGINEKKKQPVSWTRVQLGLDEEGDEGDFRLGHHQPQSDLAVLSNRVSWECWEGFKGHWSSWRQRMCTSTKKVTSDRQQAKIYPQWVPFTLRARCNGLA